MLRRTALASVAGAMSFAQEPSRPVSKVIAILEKMQSQLEGEKTEDNKLDTKMSCWCHDTGKEKDEALETAFNQKSSLEMSIREKNAKVADLMGEVEGLAKDIVSETESLAAAQTLRDETLAKFNEDEKDFLQSINALEGAITVLKEHQSFLQMPVEETMTLKKLAAVANLPPSAAQSTKEAALIKTVLQKLSGKQRRLLQSAVEQPIPDSVKQKYTTESGEVFGVLTEMLTSFKGDVEQLRKDEATSAQTFADTKAEKEDALAHLEDMKREKESLMDATSGDAKADAQQLAATLKQISADQEFVRQMELDCGDFDKNYKFRSEERLKEIEAVGKALEFLHSDAAHDLFARTFNFAQVHMASRKQNRAVAMLKSISTRFEKPEVAALAQDIKSSRFDKVFGSIDKMVGDLAEELEADTKARDLCIADLDRNDKDIVSTARDQADFQAHKDALDKRIDILTADIKALSQMIADSKQALAEAGAMREKESADFRSMLSDHNDSIHVLTQALTVMQQVYSNVSDVPQRVSLLQARAEPKPETANEVAYGRSRSGVTVVNMIQNIIQDAQESKTLAIDSEHEEQTSYEKLVQDTNSSITEYKASRSAKRIQKSEKKEERQSTRRELRHTTESLAELRTKRKARGDECQFLLNNYELRQEHMKKEIAALNNAKAFLKGMKNLA